MFLFLGNITSASAKVKSMLSWILQSIFKVPQRNSYALLLANSNVFQSFFSGMFILQYIVQYTLDTVKKKKKTCLPQSQTGIIWKYHEAFNYHSTYVGKKYLRSISTFPLTRKYS